MVTPRSFRLAGFKEWQFPLLQDVTGVGFHHQPDLLPYLQPKGMAGTRSEVHEELSSAIDLGNHRDVLLSQRGDGPSNHISGTQALWQRSRDQDVASTDSDSYRLSDVHARKGHFEGNTGACDATGHRPLLSMSRDHRALHNVLKPSQLRDRFELRT